MPHEYCNKMKRFVQFLKTNSGRLNFILLSPKFNFTKISNNIYPVSNRQINKISLQCSYHTTSIVAYAEQSFNPPNLYNLLPQSSSPSFSANNNSITLRTTITIQQKASYVTYFCICIHNIFFSSQICSHWFFGTNNAP